MPENNTNNNSKNELNVFMVSDNGLYDMPPFKHIEDMYCVNKPISFLIINSEYFYSGNKDILPPEKPYEVPYITPAYGKILYEINEGHVPQETAKEYLATYSLDGPFGKVADATYLCVPDIEKVLNYLTNKNPQIQRQGRLMLKRDRLIINLLALALDSQKNIKNKEYVEKITQKTFGIIQNMRYLPLEKIVECPEKLANTEQLLRESENSAEKYFEAVYSIQNNISKEINQKIAEAEKEENNKIQSNQNLKENESIDISIRR